MTKKKKKLIDYDNVYGDLTVVVVACRIVLTRHTTWEGEDSWKSEFSSVFYKTSSGNGKRQRETDYKGRETIEWDRSKGKKTMG